MVYCWPRLRSQFCPIASDSFCLFICKASVRCIYLHQVYKESVEAREGVGSSGAGVIGGYKLLYGC